MLPHPTDEEFPRREPFEELKTVCARLQVAGVLTAAFEGETVRRVDGIVRAFLWSRPELRHRSLRQKGRNAQGVDEGDRGRAASELTLTRRAFRAARPGAE